MTLILIFALAFLAPTTLWAADTTLAMVEVSATAERRVLADRAEFTFTVQGLGSTMGLAVEASTRATDSIVGKLIALGISKDRISTRHFTSGENQGDKAFLSSSRDYKARITTRVTVDSLPLLASAITLVSEADVEEVSSINFSLQDEASLLRDIRKEAARTARQKAEDIVGELGAKVGRLLYADESLNSGFGFGSEYGNAVGGIVNTVVRRSRSTTETAYVSAVSFNAPEMVLQAKVFARYRLE
jgi:uncharacterized protein YggE